MRRQWLVDLRGEKTQEDVAVPCGIHRGHYSLIETGERTPSVMTAKRIANYLGFEWTLFFDDKCVETLQIHDDVDDTSMNSLLQGVHVSVKTV